MSNAAVKVVFELFGDYEGKNAIIGGIQFRHGVGSAIVGSENVKHVTNYMRYYGGYLQGSPEYHAAVKARNERDGISSEPSTGAGDGKTDKVPSPDGTGVQGATVATDGTGTKTNGTSTDASGGVSSGGGHENSGVISKDAKGSNPQKKVVNDAIVRIVTTLLDPDNDEHWTDEGLPALDVVEKAYGKAGLTRKDIEAALPEFTRETAFERKLA